MFKTTTLTEAIRIDGIITLHYYDYGKKFRFPGERHNFWELVYVDLGEVKVRAGGETHCLSRGQIIFHKPEEYHSIWVEDKFASAAIITFETGSPDMAFFEGKILHVSEKQKKCIEEILKEGRAAFAEPLDILYQEEIALAQTMPFGALQMIKINLEHMLLDMVREGQARLEAGPSGKGFERRVKPSEEQVVEHVIEILQEELRGHITLDQIAAKVGFSKSYIKTLFRRNCGSSVMQAYTRMKVEYAKKLISEQKYFITEISEMLGYNSVHYFSRTFKKVTGVSPTSYSQSVRKSALL